MLKSLSTRFILSAILLATSSFAWSPIAHRGVFHDIDNSQCNSENTIGALYRANDLNVPGAELDLRLSSDGVIMVTHDQLANRQTKDDNYHGILNSIDVAIGRQPNVNGIPINSAPASTWNDAPLKSYGRNGRFVNDGTQKMETLDEMLGHYSDLISGNGGKEFTLFLDIQDPQILSGAAKLVKQHGLQNDVILKFFVKSAINSANYRYNGPETCAAYANYNGLTGLKIAPQFNDGQMTFSGGNAYIDVFNAQLTIEEVLNCWAEAGEKYHAEGAILTHVAASVPANNKPAYKAAASALYWARQNNRITISILPNPDAGFNQGGTCTLWSFQSNNVAAAQFNEDARSAKLDFINAQKPDYVIVDIMGDVSKNRFITDFDIYTLYLC